MNRPRTSILRPVIGLLLLATIIFYYAGVNMGLQEVGFAVLFPILFLFTFIVDKAFSFLEVHEFILFLLFILFSLLSIFYPDITLDYFMVDLRKTIAAFMGAYIGFVLCKYVKLEDHFHIAFIASFFLIIYFEYELGTFKPATFYAPTASRNDFTYNANYYSYMSLFANFSMFRLYLKYKNIWTLLGMIMIPISGLAISFTVQTRSGLLSIILVNVIFWFWVNKIQSSNPIYQYVRKIFLISVAVLAMFQLYTVYSDSNIKTRLSRSIGEDSRSYLVDKGIEIFLENPILGVGSGNFIKYNSLRAFTHNNYLEALAEQGLLIGSLIILVFVLPFFKSLRLFLTDRVNPKFRLNLLFFAIFLFYNNIYVFYKASNAMMYFFLMVGIHYSLAQAQKLSTQDNAEEGDGIRTEQG